MMNPEELKSNLAQFTGTECYHSHPFYGHTVWTDGVDYLIKQAKCFWLMDIILSTQKIVKNKDKRCKEMQFWTLTVMPNKTWKMVCEADKGEVMYKQSGEFTDFPIIGETKIWLEFGCWQRRDQSVEGMVAMLPNER